MDSDVAGVNHEDESDELLISALWETEADAEAGLTTGITEELAEEEHMNGVSADHHNMNGVGVKRGELTPKSGPKWPWRRLSWRRSSGRRRSSTWRATRRPRRARTA